MDEVNQCKEKEIEHGGCVITQIYISIYFKYFLGRNHVHLVHLTVKLGFVTQHLWLGDFGKCNRGLHAQTLRLRYLRSLVTFPIS